MAQPKRRLDGLILSVMHSGTWFTRQLLKNNGFGNTPTAHWGEGIIPDCPIVITPIRHPDAVYGSWVSRGKPVERLPGLIELQTMFHGELLPIDSPRRDEYLERLSERIGVKLKTDWLKVHCINSAPVVSGLYEKHRDFYGPIYEG